MKLRLYHHPDGTRIAYREVGTGPPLALLHSAGFSHREWEPLAAELSDRFRLVLPDLPLHGDSEDGPKHPYTPEWITGVLAGFIRDTCGPKPLVGGHEIGALLLLRAVADGVLTPSRLVLMSSALHRPAVPERRGARAGAAIASLPGFDLLISHAARLAFRPATGARFSARANPAARDLIRHATADLRGNGPRTRAWAKAIRRWPREQPELRAAYARLDMPVLLLWADSDPAHPPAIAEEARDQLRDALVRVLPQTGFLLAYDDPVGLARELAAFCNG